MRAPRSELPIRLEEASVAAAGVAILDRVSLTISSGAPTVLIGPNGSGKTTLLRVAMGLTPLTGGRVAWGGLEHVDAARRALVFQRPVMLRRSAAANLRYALGGGLFARARHAPRVAELLDLVGLAGLGERPAPALSGGEQQRLALARALARDPAVLFLDEPGASLDPAAAKAVEDVIRAVAARGVKVVMSTHDVGAARRLAGDIVFMNRGRVPEHAPAAEFFAAPATREARLFLAGALLV